MKKAIIKNLAALFQKHYHQQPEKIEALRGDASDRKIFRLFGKDFTCIGIHGNNPDENAAFLEFSRHFYKHHLRVPEIYCKDNTQNIYLEEDLGDDTLYNWLTIRREDVTFPQEAVAMYKQVLSALPHFQIRAGKNIDYSYCYQYKSFQYDAMWYDMQYFLNRFADAFTINPYNRQAVETDLKSLVRYCEQIPAEYFLYRDFQSRNVMIHKGEPYFIDYQSGRRGALQYDVASMLFDAKANIPLAVKKELLEHYKSEVGKMIQFDAAHFDHYFYEYALVRVLQALGAFGNLGLVKKKMHFIKSIPYGLNNIEILLLESDFFQDLKHLRSIFEQDLLINPKLREIT